MRFLLLFVVVAVAVGCCSAPNYRPTLRALNGTLEELSQDYQKSYILRLKPVAENAAKNKAFRFARLELLRKARENIKAALGDSNAE